MLGVVIDLALMAGADTSYVVAAKNWAMDLTLRRHVQLSAPSLPMVLVDVDEETWRSTRWDSGPTLAPRQQLAALIKYGLRKDAQIVVVDILVEDPKQPADGDFLREVAQLARNIPATKRLVFVRSVREPLYGDTRLAAVQAPSILDELPQSTNGRVAFAAPYFESDRDGIVRSWRLWRPACVADSYTDGQPSAHGTWRVLPSVQLLVKAQLSPPGDRSPTPWDFGKSYGRCLASPQGLDRGIGAVPECAVNTAVWRWLNGHPEILGRKLEDERGLCAAEPSAFDPSSRIFYASGYPPEHSSIQILSALKVLEAADAHGGFSPIPHTDVIRAGIFIIGQSSEFVGDVHATPLGAMPGSLIIANAVESLNWPGAVVAPPGWAEFAIELFLIAIVALAFALFDSFTGMLVICLPLLICIMAANYFCLRAGYWLDFAVPLLAIYVHNMWKSFEDSDLMKNWRVKRVRKSREKEG